MTVYPLEQYLQVEVLDHLPKDEKVLAAATMSTASQKFLEEREEYVKTLLYLIRRGFASLQTTPHVLVKLQGSRVLDFFFTAIPYGSYLVRSQRFTLTDISVLPKELRREDIEKNVRRRFEFYKKVVEIGGVRGFEMGRRILPLGTPTHLVMALSLDALAHALKLAEQEPVPREVKQVLEEIDRRIPESLRAVWEACKQSPQINYLIPQIFNERELPQEPRLEVLEKCSYELDEALAEISQLLRSFRPCGEEEFRKNARQLGRLCAEHAEKYIVELNFPCSISCQNELKRHRSVLQKPESIYKAAEKALKDENRIHIPPVVQQKEELLKEYIDLTYESLELYEKYKEEVGKELAIYLIPQNIIINNRIVLNLNHLRGPFMFYSIRACSVAEHEIQARVRQLPKVLPEVREILEIEGMPLPKCVCGFCPEPKERREKYGCKIYERIWQKLFT
ncbi:MAG: hypothetical protein GXO42_00645 [bacterium]|nr:hypothetical protein [bacterium]